MQEHVQYWTSLRDKGVAIAFGPVLDPRSVWGVAIVEVVDEAGRELSYPTIPWSKQASAPSKSIQCPAP